MAPRIIASVELNLLISFLRAVALSTLISGRQGAQHDLKLGAAPVDLGEAHGQYLMLFVHHAVKKGATAQKGKGGALA
jgi:hypothetical protein